MYSIDKEKNILYDIAKKDFATNVEKDYLKSNFTTEESYYLDKSTDDADYLMEYDFRNPMELKSILENKWDDPSEKSMIQAIMVATFKMQNASVRTEELPEKIYNF